MENGEWRVGTGVEALAGEGRTSPAEASSPFLVSPFSIHLIPFSIFHSSYSIFHFPFILFHFPFSIQTLALKRFLLNK
jgi:hypothetical protein